MSRRNVMGIDIVRGSPLSRTSTPLYAVVVVDDNGKIVYETTEAPLKRIVRLAWEYHVAKIGVDNIYELAPNSRAIAKLLSLLPDDVEIIQVTYSEGAFHDLREQLTRIGIELESKPRPLQTAYLNALLALHGIGTPIRAVEYRTKIIVSRGRSVGAGGSSANRYARSMRGAVLRMVRKIKEALDKASLNYDLMFRKSSGGLDSAVFIVYAPRSALRGIVKPVKGHDVRVIIRPEYRSIMFLDEVTPSKKNYVIVGVDPGIETGLAIIDLSLKPLLITSSRELDRAAILNKVYSVGIPVLIATDKNPPPETVKKLASTLGLPLYVPPRSLSVSEKEMLIEWFKKKIRGNINITTTHERDALAAALKAYKNFERKFLEIERRVKELGIDVDIDELKLLLMKGKTIDEVIEYAVEQYLEEEFYQHQQDHTVNLRIVQGPKCDERIQELEKQITELIREREHLRDEIKRLRKEVEELQFQLRYRPPIHVEPDELKERELAGLKEKLRQLQNYTQNLTVELEHTKANLIALLGIIRRVISGELVLIPRIETLSYKDFAKVRDLVGKTRVVYVSNDVIDMDLLKELRGSDLVLLFRKCCNETYNLVLSHSIPLVCNVDPEHEFEEFIVLRSEMYRELVERARENLKRYTEELERKRRSELSLDKLISIIEEYRKSISKNDDISEESDLIF